MQKPQANQLAIQTANKFFLKNEAGYFTYKT
jgi:hypothetical protein